MPQINRWLPLIGLIVLIGTTLLRLFGAVTQAEWVESIGKTLALPVHSPIGAVEVGIAVAALYGVSRKLYATFVGTLKQKGGWRSWVPMAATVGLLATVILRAKGHGALADLLETAIGVHAPVSPAEFGGAALGGYGLVIAMYRSVQRARKTFVDDVSESDR